MTMDPKCNGNKARLEDHPTSLEGLEVRQTSQVVLRTNLEVRRTNLEVPNDNKVRQEDLQISLEDLEVHQTNLEARRTNLEDRQIKEDLLPRRWIQIQVTLMTKHHLRQKEKLPLKENNRLQKENHLQRESRGRPNLLLLRNLRFCHNQAGTPPPSEDGTPKLKLFYVYFSFQAF